ncbi:MAG: serine/threonine protein kinase [Planctomycetaceae bacterium]|nr:serine/threonine protein kinase [Planctomycetaceae bacterium]
MMQPEKLGPYNIGTILGRGGMGAVYQGVDEKTGDVVAVKVLLSTLEDNEELHSRFELEIDTLKHLRHPNIVRLYGFGEEAGLLYYVMEYVQGKSLYQELKKRRVFEWYEVAKIGLVMSLALKHAHDRGITHRDIKPANIMLDENGQVKLSDFGIAQYFGSQRLTEINSVVGTLEYMSPEQALAAPLGYKSDIYSLGAVLYALVIGKPPFSAKNLVEVVRKHQSGTMERFHDFRTDVPEELETIIFDMLKINPEERPANMYLLTKRFQSLLQALIGSPELITVKPLAEMPDVFQRPSGLGKAGIDSGGQESSRQDNREDMPPAPPIPKKTNITSLADSFGQQGGDTVNPTLIQYGADHYAATGDFSLATGIAPKSDTSQDNGLLRETDEKISDSKLQGPPPVPTSEHSSAELSKNAEAPQNKEPDTYGLKNDSGPSSQTSHYENSSNKHVTEKASSQTTSTPELSSRFVKIDDKEYESYDSNREKRPAISLEIIFASISLILIGVAVWYSIQSIPPDKLYKRITAALNINDEQLVQKQSEDDSIELPKAPPSVSKDIKDFLELYPNHPKAEQVRFLEDQLALVNKERELERRLQLTGMQKLIPIERDYLEAVATVKTNPELTVIKLQALLDLYGNESNSSSGERQRSRPSRPNQCLEVARQRLRKLENDVSSIIADQKHLLEQRLSEARQLEKTTPEHSAAIYRGLIELYKDRPWAEELVKQARDALKKNSDKERKL